MVSALLKTPCLYGERSLSRVVWEVSNKQSVYFIILGIYILIFFLLCFIVRQAARGTNRSPLLPGVDRKLSSRSTHHRQGTSAGGREALPAHAPHPAPHLPCWPRFNHHGTPGFQVPAAHGEGQVGGRKDRGARHPAQGKSRAQR